MMQVGAPSSGCTSRVALATASLTLARASVAASWFLPRVHLVVVGGLHNVA